MAECANSPSSLELPVWKGCGRVGRSNVPRSCHLSTPHSRKNFRRSSKFELIFTPKWAPARTLKPIVSPLRKDGSWSCSCLAALADPDGATLSDWVSVSNQLLLLTSIFLTYMAGVIPVQKSHSSSQKTVLEENSVRKNLKSPGGTRNSNDQVNLNQAWNDVKAKLLDSLDAVEHNSYLVEDFLKSEKQHPNRPLSLDAVSGGSKLRLLWASFYHLEEEVNDILGDNNAVTLNGWMTMFPKVINNSCHAVCTAWLKEELQLESNKSDKVLASLMIEKLKRDDAALRNIRKYGKEDLYAELLYFLKFGSSRNARLYDHSLFVTHGDSILEDLVINIADGIANLYLELISVDGSLPDGMNDLGTAMCSLSTRALQRLRNEIALNQWLYQNMETVASIYEDRFDLCVLQLKAIEEPTHTQEGDHTSWWKRLSLTKSSAVSSSFECIVICQFRMPAKRTKELRALTGWRYYYSLYLELYDIGLPLVRAVIDKISSAISFFLVTLIGRSLGLIYSGIRQSLRWK
ncbi:unnamed protein product [Linum trigynum]|uniref:Phosphoglycolate phosphatase n=1 Tax=Linum trigynum TaxID=586398 RepID=A0AAV2EW53_9ROSI